MQYALLQTAKNRIMHRMEKSSQPIKSSPERREQYRRAKAARRAKFVAMEILFPPDLAAVLANAAADLEGGKHGYVLDLVSKHFQRKGLYTPPAPPDK